MKQSSPLFHFIVPFSLWHELVFIRCYWMLVVSLTLLSICLLNCSEILFVLSRVLPKINLLLTLFKSMVIVFFLLLLWCERKRRRLLLLLRLLFSWNYLLMRFLCLRVLWLIHIEHIRLHWVEYRDLFVLLIASPIKCFAVVIRVHIWTKWIIHHHSHHLVLRTFNFWRIVKETALYSFIPKF